MIRDTVSKSPFLPAWVWLIPVGAVVLLYEALQPAPRDPGQRVVWFSVLIIIGTAALTKACRAQKQFDLFEPLHMVFVLFLIFYPVRALFAVWLEESWFDPARAAAWKGLWASVVGFVCFAIGYKIARGKFDGGRRIWLDRSWNLHRANTVSLLFLVVGIAGFVAVHVLGGSLLYFISLDSDIKAPGEVKSWFFYLLWICVFMQVGALLQLGSWLSTGRRTLWTLLYCVLTLVSTILLSRYFTVLFLTMLALCSHYQRRKIKPLQVVAVFFVLLAYLSLAGLYREWTSPASSLEEAAGLGELAGQQTKLVLRYVVHDLEQLSNLTEVISMTPSELPYQFGSTFAPVFLKPVPRVLMPTKPLGASALFSRQFIPELYDSGLVTGLGSWGEWYLNFSWPGLALGMALTGALTVAAYRTMLAANELGRVLLYSAFVVGMFTWLRNDFNSAATFYLYYSIPAVLGLAYITKTNPGLES